MQQQALLSEPHIVKSWTIMLQAYLRILQKFDLDDNKATNIDGHQKKLPP
jgi:hypothetical protein